MRTRAASLGLLLLASCSTQATPVSSGIDVVIDPFYVPPGGEVQNCIYLKVPSDTDLDIGHVLLDFAEGTHHMHVYYGDEQHDDGSESCFQAVNFDKWHLLVGEQRPHTEWTLPKGVAFHVKAHQQLLIQVHFVNAMNLTTGDNMASGKIHFDTVDSSTVNSYMGSIFGQQRGIDIKPHSSFSVDGICPVPHAIHMGALAGHYHFTGKDFIAYRMNSDGTNGQEFYRADSFAEPAFTLYGDDNPLSFNDGERILWHCDYQNNSDNELPFGPKELTQEHCNMFGFYYPAASEQEFTPCVSYGRCTEECEPGQTCNMQGECVDDGSQGDGGPNPVDGGVPPDMVNTQGPDLTMGGNNPDLAMGGSPDLATPPPADMAKPVCGTVESEPNDSSATANNLCSSTIQGAIASASDEDWYSFDLAPGDNYDISLSNLPADYNFKVYHLSQAGNLSYYFTADDWHDLADQLVSSTSIVGGTYLVKVYSYAGESDPNSNYTLSVVTY
jgi:hypothetical protein